MSWSVVDVANSRNKLVELIEECQNDSDSNPGENSYISKAQVQKFGGAFIAVYVIQRVLRVLGV